MLIRDRNASLTDGTDALNDAVAVASASSEIITALHGGEAA